MATGDEAAAASMDLVPGSTPAKDIDTEINKTRDYIAQARAYAAGLVSGISLTWGSITGKPTHYASRSDIVGRPGVAGSVEQALNDIFGLAAGALSRAGGVMTGHFYSPPARSTPVSTSYVAAYLNSDGRLGATPSARRFKKNIKRKIYTHADAVTLGRLVSTYKLTKAISGLADAPAEVGVIAEELIAAGFAEFVAFDEDGQAFSVHYERLALVSLSALAHDADLEVND